MRNVIVLQEHTLGTPLYTPSQWYTPGRFWYTLGGTIHPVDKHCPKTPLKKPANNHSISPKDNLKYLGVLDNKSSWKPHIQKVKTQLSRASGVISKLKHCTRQSVLKVVYNSLIHPYLNYSILNWGRAPNASIQPFIKLQNKAMKLIRPTKTASLGEPFQHLNILWVSKLYTMSVGKFMHSYYNKLLPNLFDDYFIPICSIHSHSTILSTSNSLFLPRVNSSSGKCSLTFVGPKAQKCGLQHQTILSLQPLLLLNGNSRNTPYMKKIHNYEL